MTALVRCAALLLFCLSLAARAQDDNPIAESQVHLREAARAYREGDLDAVAASLETAHALNPSSLYTQYNLACTYARIGRQDDALKLLDDLTGKRIDFGMADDPDLESLRDNAHFAELVERLDRSTRPVINSTPYYEFEQLGLAPEGIAADTETNRLFFGSMRTGDIYVLDGERRVSKFAGIDAGHGMSAIGMTVDRSLGLLWVVGATFDLAEHFDPDKTNAGGLFGFNLETGALERDYIVRGDDAGFNDVTVAPDGIVYVSGGVVHVLDPDIDMLVPVPGSGPVFGGNGLTVDDEGRTLFVASYPVGLVAIDRETGATRRIAEPDDLTLYGVDGLYWHDGGLVAVQNGARPWRLLRLSVSDEHDAITGVEIIEIANEATTPMTGAIVGDHMYYIGEGAAPENPPAHFPATLARNSGPVVIRRANLKP